MSDLSKVSPDTLIILVTLFTVLISQNFSLDQTNVVGNVFAQIGASLLTKAAQDSTHFFFKFIILHFSH